MEALSMAVCEQEVSNYESNIKIFRNESGQHLEESDFNIPMDIYPNWERMETNEGIPYYVLRRTGEGQSINPRLMEIISQTNFDNVIYSAWRMGEKIKYLAEELMISSLKYSDFIDMIDWNPADDEIEIDQVIHILKKIYHHLISQGENCGEMWDFVDKILNWVILVSDKKCSSRIDVDAFNLSIIVFTVKNIKIMHKNIFQTFTRNTRNIMKNDQFNKLLFQLSTMARLLGESYNVDLSLFEKISLKNDEFNYDEYYAWTRKDKTVVPWLNSLCYLNHSQNGIHYVSCSICRRRPIQGLQFKCLHCHNYNMCKKCCLSGQKTSNHQLGHQICVHSQRISTKRKIKEYYKMMRNTLKKNKTNKALIMTKPDIIRISSFKLENSTLHSRIPYSVSSTLEQREMLEEDLIVSQARNMEDMHDNPTKENKAIEVMSMENTKLENQLKALKTLLIQSEMFDEEEERNRDAVYGYNRNLLRMTDDVSISLCRLIQSL